MIDYKNIAERLMAVRSEIDAIEYLVLAYPHPSHEGGQLAAHVTTARDSASVAVSSALLLALRTLTDSDRSVAQDGRQLAAEIATRGRGHAGRQPWQHPADWTPSYVVCWQGILVALDGQCEIEDACIGEVAEFEECHPGSDVTDAAALGIVEQWPAGLIEAVEKQTAPDERQGD